MNDLTAQITGEFIAERALILYKWQGNRPEYYMELHPIDANGAIGAGQPLSSKMLDDLAVFLNERRRENSSIGGVVPTNLLYCDWGEERKVMMWYNDPMARMMHFTESLKIKSGVAWQPGLLYLLQDEDLSVWAIKGEWPWEHKLSDLYDVVLFRAPYHNVGEDGDVCMGSASAAKPKKLTYDSVISYWEAMFWNSEFSHLRNDESPIAGNINTYWNKAIEGHKMQPGFDTEVLLEVSGMRVTDVLKRINQSGNIWQNI